MVVRSPLADYQRKRDFVATPEPAPQVARRKRAGLIFVIQKHQARRLHYDFRLELDGVLKSWAVTREPGDAPGDKRLAVHVEDHPVAYADFHGDIPQGHYGAGHVDIWDRGTWKPAGDPHAGLREGHLDFELDGERLRGRFVLVRMKQREGERDTRDNWLLIPRRSDAGAPAGAARKRAPAVTSRDRAPAARSRASAPRSAAQEVIIAGVTITHPARALAQVPEAVKADLARYYEEVGPQFMPQIAQRPLALIKCPGGDFAQCFFAKHAGDPRRAAQRPAEDPPYMRMPALRNAIEAVQNGAIEFHTWGASFPRLDRPDRLILDLDPDTGVSWTQFRAAAERVRALLDRLELRWLLKTTGGKGLHFVLPIERRHSWDEVKTFAAALARRLAADDPDVFIATASKARRKGLVFVDWLRNAEGATAVAAYSLRARAGLPVSMPIEWRELAQDVRGDWFNWRNVARHLAARKRDPWAGYDAARQRLRASALRALG